MRPVAIVLVGLLLCAQAARGEIFILKNDGQVRGQLLNADQSPRTTYHIKTPSGGQVLLKAEQVKQVVRQSENQMEFDRVRPDFADTVSGNWELAQWCKEHYLPKERRELLERVLELDADHAQARAALGYFRKDGRWVTQELLQTEAGYVKYQGKWRLPQEVELLEERRKSELAEKGWFAKVRRWYGWLGTDRDEEARAALLEVKDAAAVKALVQYLSSEEEREIKQLFIEVLANIGSDAAMGALADHALNDADEEIRLTCLDRLSAADYRPAVNRFLTGLKSMDNKIVNRAGVALQHMNDPAAIGPLIEALETVHKFKIVKGNPGQMSSTFNTGGAGAGGGGFSFGGGGTEIIKQSIRNKDVLRALVKLTGTNFEFDRQAWKTWFATQRKHKSLDARRDS
jgi:hypothetical protein